MSKMLIESEDFEYKYKDVRRLFYQYNTETPDTIFLYDDNKKIGGSNVGCLEIWYDDEDGQREYIIINDEIHYLDTLDEL